MGFRELLPPLPPTLFNGTPSGGLGPAMQEIGYCSSRFAVALSSGGRREGHERRGGVFERAKGTEGRVYIYSLSVVPCCYLISLSISAQAPKLEALCALFTEVSVLAFSNKIPPPGSNRSQYFVYLNFEESAGMEESRRHFALGAAPH